MLAVVVEGAALVKAKSDDVFCETGAEVELELGSVAARAALLVVLATSAGSLTSLAFVSGTLDWMASI